MAGGRGKGIWGLPRAWVTMFSGGGGQQEVGGCQCHSPPPGPGQSRRC